MKLNQFLGHHGIKENPFGQEDAQTDQVFKQHCRESTHHPAWDKIYGDPIEPGTAVVFGEKGSGKTALRLQIVQQVEQFNQTHPDQRVFVIEYDDFNPYLDSFRERLIAWQKSPDKALTHWRLWDHMDAMLTLGVTRLVNLVNVADKTSGNDGKGISRGQLENLSHLQRRDLLLLAAFYDHSLDQAPSARWGALRRKLAFSNWKAQLDWCGGAGVTLLVLIIWWMVKYETLAARFGFFAKWWFWLIMVVTWGPWLWRQARLLWTASRVRSQIRVFDHQTNTLRGILSRFEGDHLANQPIPSRDRSDDRYELMNKFRSVLKSLGYNGVLVIVDRVDEPHLINGNPERMKSLVWPLFDNKFLKHPGFGFKLLLPSEVYPFLNRETKEFYERSRMDKQNLIPSLEWTGESLYDLANARLQACTSLPGSKPVLKDWFEERLTLPELVSVLARLRVPRHLFKFLYKVLVTHCNKYTSEEPQWKIDRETLHSEMALYQRDLHALDRGLGTV